MQMRHNAVLIYSQPQYHKGRKLSLFRISNMQEQRQQRYSGKLSPSAKKRLARATTLLVQSIKPAWIYNEVTKRQHLHKLSFITLTISDPTKKLTGKEAYKQLLSHFLQWLRRTKNCTTYIWKAELQINGQIHYHITTPSFINYQEIRDKWNNLQKKAGLLEKYHADKGHYNANSTDIHEVNNIENMAGYLIKYITKSYQNEISLGGKVWDCSQNLKKNNYFKVEVNQDHDYFLKLAVENDLATYYQGEQFLLYKFNEPVIEHLLTKKEYQQFREFISCIHNGNTYEYPKSKLPIFTPYIPKVKTPTRQRKYQLF